MEVCGGVYPDTHDEIVYDAPDCPLCAAEAKIKRLEKEIADLELRIN